MKTLLLNPLFLLTFIFFTLPLSAQDYPEYNQDNNSNSQYSSYNHTTTTPSVSPRILKMMQQLKNTRFMYNYTTLQIEIEETIALIKANQQLYTPEDIQQIKIAYRITGNEFNRVLNEIKRDLLRGKYKAKNIAALDLQLERKNLLIKRLYNKSFKNPIDLIMQGEVVSSSY